MTAQVVLVSAPVMSVLRPSMALGLLQETLHQRGVTATSLYLNLLFAEHIGVDLNEALAEDIPSEYLVGEWLFQREVGCSGSAAVVTDYETSLSAVLQRRDIGDLGRVRETVVPKFVDAAVDAILAERPRLVGFTTMFAQTMASLAIARRIKQMSPEITICFGGPNCHGPMGAQLLKHFDAIDYVFNGEADTIFVPFVEAVLSGRVPVASPALLARTGAGRACPPAPMARMDDLPVPDFSDYFRQISILSDIARISPSLPFESSRGCWWGQKHHCTFCGLNAESMVFREKSSARVLEEIEILAKRHDTLLFAATDNILSMRHLREVMPRLAERKMPLRMFYEIKSNLDEAGVIALAEAGVVWLQPGIESLSDIALKAMRKGVSGLLNLRLLRLCRELGIRVSWSFLYGFVGESADDYRELAALLPVFEHLPPPFGCGRIRLDRFSPNFESAAEFGFTDVQPAPAYGAIFGLPPQDLQDLAYFFTGHAEGAAREADLVELKQATAVWRSRWFDDIEPPVLQAATIGARALIRDTRACRTDEYYYAEALEVALLDLFRSPRATADATTLASRWSIEAIEAALIQLLGRRFLVARGGSLLSLVTSAGNERFDDADWSAPPFGYLMDAEPATREDVACL